MYTPLSFVLCALAAVNIASAYPGMGNLMAELAKRQGPPVQPIILIGDLGAQGATTPVGQRVVDCFNGLGCQSDDSYSPPSGLHSEACREDICCVWDFIAKELEDLYLDNDGTCNRLARSSVRLGFHDAGAWSQTSGSGGADGSLILTDEEIDRPENRGLQAVRTKALELLTKYRGYGYEIGAADLVQFMHNVATVVCPLGPRLLTLIGRDDSPTPNPTGLLPDTNSPPPVIVELFANKTIGVKDLISLIGAHTTANQFFVDPAKASQPLDSTPGIWDVKFYEENLLPESPEGVFRLPSDTAFANGNNSRGGFVTFSDPVTGQATWNEDYSVGYVRLSLLGVNKVNQLVDCTKVLPPSNPVGPVPRNHTSSSSVGPHSTTSSSSFTSSSISGVYTASSSDGYPTPSTGVYPPFINSTSSAVQNTTSTLYSTTCYTITYSHTTKTITSTIAIGTTVCPVSATPIYTPVDHGHPYSSPTLMPTSIQRTSNPTDKHATKPSASTTYKPEIHANNESVCKISYTTVTVVASAGHHTY
ncbi:heme peroxidase [Clohesyomyces aquaticus]|uniref:Peroxidase n=1 Tax=Clohesyomyces aquaticus TaxID=1231657 RepID=A0A1Y1Y930_9PLEO|nr:heme peroxidase [Clohesyomyces aquaticus]